MFTLVTLSDAISAYTEQNNNPEPTFVAQTPTFIRLAEERILKSAQLEEFSKTVSIDWAADERCGCKPDDWMATYSMTFRDDSDASVRFSLLRKDKTFLDEYWPDYTLTGTPKYYTDHDVDTFTVAPTPDSANVVTIHYLRRPTSLVDEASGTWLSTNAPQALLYGCLVEAYGFLKGEQEMIAFYETRFVDALGRMKNHGEGLEPDDSYRRGFIRTNPN